jgi:hypothetical protein
MFLASEYAIVGIQSTLLRLQGYAIKAGKIDGGG